MTTAAPAPWLSTARLDLRRFVESDHGWLCELYADEDVTRYLGGTLQPSQVAAMLRERVLEYYDARPGLGIWMTVERESGRRVGFHLLNNIRGEEDIQIGFSLLKDSWGKGYGTEMAAAVLRYGFADLTLPRIVAIANLPNLASQHVLQKIGLHRRGERAFSHPQYAAAGPMAWFERDRDDWLSERGLAAATPSKRVSR